MIDYKLVLILVLSIVLLYLYNKVDYLKEDFKNQKKIQNNQKELIETISKNLDIITQRNIELEKKFRLSNNLVNNLESNVESLKPKVVCEDGICKMPKNNDEQSNIQLNNDSINKLNITLLNNEKNTTDFSATENDSDSESLNLTSSDNIILYSNDKSEKSSLNKSDKESVESIDTTNIIDVENIEITHDLQKDNTIMLEANTIDEIINVESLIDKLNEKPVLLNKTFLNTNLNKNPSSYLEIIDSSNSIDEYNGEINKNNDKSQDDNLDNDNNLENNIITENKKSYSDIDYDSSENKLSDKSESKTLEKNLDSVYLDDLNKYKLNDLQNIAKDKNIELTTFKNGKIKNKTKKELYNEISSL